MKPISILLDSEQSEILTDAGTDAFAVVGRGTWPDSPGRWVVYLIPCDIKTADAACRVARGLSKESKPRKP
jgi:hypothetical protein